MSELDERTASVQSGSEACNRQPFLSEDGCDRGNVDTHQFDDLPFCGDIYPTKPKIPPEVFDINFAIPTPPHCSCININYSYKFNGFKEKFKTKQEFKSNGDCCEGNYDSDLEFELPCPIEKIGKKVFSAELKWLEEGAEEGTSFEEVYVEDKEDDCGFVPEDIKFQIGLPCPIPERVEMKANFSWDYESSSSPEPEGGFDADPVDVIVRKEDDCGIEIPQESPEIKFNIPCPVPREKKMSIKLKWNEQSEDEHEIIKRKNGCLIDTSDVNFQIGLNCPISRVPAAGLAWNVNNYQTGATKRYPYERTRIVSGEYQVDVVDLSEDEIVENVATLRVVDCVFIKTGVYDDTKTSTFWTLDGVLITPGEVKQYLCCAGEIACQDCNCPEGSGKAKKIRICLDVGDEDTACVEDNIAMVDEDECKIDVASPRMKLRIPCPVGDMEITYTNQVEVPTLVKKEECSGFELKLPNKVMQIITGGEFDPATKRIVFHYARVRGFFQTMSEYKDPTQFIQLPTAKHICR